MRRIHCRKGKLLVGQDTLTALCRRPSGPARHLSAGPSRDISVTADFVGDEACAESPYRLTDWSAPITLRSLEAFGPEPNALPSAATY